MKHFTGLIYRIAKTLDNLAGACLFCVMLLIIANILLRGILGRPILGTYEIVGFLTALCIGLALAHCALQDGHIAVSLFTDRLSKKTQSLVAIFIDAGSFVFWSAAAWYLFQFGQSMKLKGLVSPSAEIPVYPIIYLVAVGLSGLCLALLGKLVFSFRERYAFRPFPIQSLSGNTFKAINAKRATK